MQVRGGLLWTEDCRDVRRSLSSMGHSCRCRPVTAIATILSPAYDAPVRLPADLYLSGAKRAMVRTELERVEVAGHEKSARLMWWELG